MIEDSEDSLTLREVLMLTSAVDKARGISGNTNLNNTTGVADLRDLPPSSFRLRCGIGAAAGLDHTAVKGEQDQDQHQDASETNDSGVDHDCENDDTNKKMLESHDVRRRDPHAGPEPMQEDFRAAQGTLSIQSILHNRASSSSVASASLEVSSLSAVSAGPSHSIGSAVSECSIVGMLEVVDEHHRHQQQEHPPHLVVEPTPEHLTTTKATKTSATTTTQPPVGGSLSTSTPSSSSSFSATAANAAATNAVMELQRLLQHASDDSVHDNPRYATTTTTSANTTTGLAAPSVVLTLHRPPPTRARCGRHANLIIKHSSPATPSTSPLNTNPTDTRFLSARGFCSTPQVFLSAALQLHPVANGEAVKSLAAGPPYQDAGSADTSGAGGMVHTPISIPTATTTAGSGDISFGTPSPSLSPSAAASHEPSFVGAVGTSAGSPAAREQEDSIVSSPSSSTTSLPPSPSPSMLAERKANECDCHRSVVKPTPTTRSLLSLPEGQEKDEVEQEQRRHTRRTALGCITPTPPVTPAEPTRTPHSEDHTTTTTTTAALLIDTAGGVVNTPPHSNPVVALDDMATTTATGQLLASSQCSCAREEDAKQGVSMEQEFLDDVDAMLTASDLEEMDKLFRCLYTIQYESASAGQATHI